MTQTKVPPQLEAFTADHDKPTPYAICKRCWKKWAGNEQTHKIMAARIEQNLTDGI